MRRRRRKPFVILILLAAMVAGMIVGIGLFLGWMSVRGSIISFGMLTALFTLMQIPDWLDPGDDGDEPTLPIHIY